MGEDHHHKLWEAALKHLDTTIDACNAQAWGQHRQSPHPIIHTSLDQEDVVELTDLRAKMKEEEKAAAENWNTEREAGSSGDFEVGKYSERAI